MLVFVTAMPLEVWCGVSECHVKSRRRDVPQGRIRSIRSRLKCLLVLLYYRRVRVPLLPCEYLRHASDNIISGVHL